MDRTEQIVILLFSCILLSFLLTKLSSPSSMVAGSYWQLDTHLLISKQKDFGLRVDSGNVPMKHTQWPGLSPWRKTKRKAC